MSIRVTTADVGLASQTAQVEQQRPTGLSGSTGAASGKAAEDHIEVSAAAENISSAFATQNLQHLQKVQNLSNLVANGRYAVDSGNLSRAIVAGAIGGPAGAE